MHWAYVVNLELWVELFTMLETEIFSCDQVILKHTKVEHSSNFNSSVAGYMLIETLSFLIR